MLAEQVTTMNKSSDVTPRASLWNLSKKLTVITAAVAGLVLSGCANQSGNRAPVNDLNNASSSSAVTAKTYTVKPGDTLNKISRSTGVDENTIKRLNKISDPKRIYPGLILKLSDGSESAAAPTGPTAIAANTKAEARPLDQSAQSSAPAATESAAPSRAADAGVINWGWPAQGKVIQGYTANTKGIDIAGNAGDPVIAAANGTVMYSGNGVRGLGNLIIVDHDNGFITAYAHNRALVVKTGQKVKKGAKIAEMGQSDASSVKLHFEVRRQGTPVDPMQYLPAK
jgi:lipoprotein NlpD